MAVSELEAARSVARLALKMAVGPGHNVAWAQAMIETFPWLVDEEMTELMEQGTRILEKALVARENARRQREALDW